MITATARTAATSRELLRVLAVCLRALSARSDYRARSYATACAVRVELSPPSTCHTTLTGAQLLVVQIAVMDRMSCILKELPRVRSCAELCIESLVVVQLHV